MNVFSRLLLAILLLAIAATAISLIALAWTIPEDTIGWLAGAVRWLDVHNQDLEKALLTSGGALLALVCLSLALFELMPRSGSEVKVTDLKIGDAYLSTAAVGQRVEEAVTQVPHISDVRATVKAKRNGVTVALDLHVDPEANLATVTDEACDAARDVLASRVHVALVEPPRARLHYRELRLSRAVAARRPLSAASTPPAGTEQGAPEPVSDTQLAAVAAMPFEERPDSAAGGSEAAAGAPPSDQTAAKAPGGEQERPSESRGGLGS